MRPSGIPNTGYMPNYDLGMSASYPTMSLAELENNSLSVEESEQRISQMILQDRRDRRISGIRD